MLAQNSRQSAVCRDWICQDEWPITRPPMDLCRRLYISRPMSFQIINIMCIISEPRRTFLCSVKNCESAKLLFFNVFESHHVADHGLGNYGNPPVATTTHTCPRHLFVWHRPFGCTKFCSSVHSGGRKKALLAEGADPVTLSPNSWSLSPEYNLFDCLARGEATCRESAKRYISWNRTWNPWSYQS